jgi:hypothetical protein
MYKKERPTEIELFSFCLETLCTCTDLSVVLRSGKQTCVVYRYKQITIEIAIPYYPVNVKSLMIAGLHGRELSYCKGDEWDENGVLVFPLNLCLLTCYTFCLSRNYIQVTQHSASQKQCLV